VKIGRTQAGRRDNEQSILPLINIVFLLLIFFMVAGKLSQSDPVRIDTPVSGSESETEVHNGRFLIDREGRLYHGGGEVEREGIGTILQGFDASREDVIVKADALAPTGTVLSVITDIRAAGIREVKLLTLAEQK
jgi:biopolymer transport protein ExbD